MRLKMLTGLLFSFLFVGCKAPSTDLSTSALVRADEISDCTTTRSVGTDVNISGTAVYYVRQTQLVLQSGKTVGILGNPSSTAYPIEKAEVRLVDSGGTVINCGSTDSSGAFTIKAPPNGNYTLKVLSRSRDPNGNFSVSVKEDIYSNTLYELSTSVNSGASGTSGLTLSAYARKSQSSKVTGAAFNILDRIVKANNLITPLAGIDLSCLRNNKVHVFWKAGFNPNSYRSYPDDPLSYYMPGDHQLFILGGKNGDMAFEDTDHFDDSVIVHEYGHFLEDVCGHSDSPGGSHNGNFLIDPRLAWSEGWANYFQTTVTGDKYYIDTIGFSDSLEGGSGQNGITLDLSESGPIASRDAVVTAGEGTFREVSISRSLYKMTNPSSGTAVPFLKIWNAFASLSSTTESFRNVGLFNMALNAFLNSPSPHASLSTFTSTIACAGAGECQSASSQYYGQKLISQASPCSPSTESLTPVIDSSYGYIRSNQFRSNKFYRFTYAGSSSPSSTLTLTFTGSGTPSTDLDLIVYSKDYIYSEDSGVTGSSSILRSSRSIQTTAGTYTETVNLSGLAAGTYMVNVKAKTYGKSAGQIGSGATFQLSLGSNYLCPSSTWTW